MLLLLLLLQGILLSEAFPNPLFDEALNEWLELTNTGPEAVDLANWTLLVNGKPKPLHGGQYRGAGTLLLPGRLAIITDSETRVYDNFAVPPEALRLYTTNLQLANKGSTISLLDDEETVRDTLTYQDTPSNFSWAHANGTTSLTLPTPGSTNLPGDCDWALTSTLTRTELHDSPNWTLRLDKVFGPPGDLLLARAISSEGSLVKEYALLNLSSVRQHRTFSLHPLLLPSRSYTYWANLTVPCDHLLENNLAQASILIGALHPSEPTLALLEVLDLGPDKEAHWGQAVRVRFSAYRSNASSPLITLTSSLKGRAMGPSSTMTLDNLFQATTATLPLSLEERCENTTQTLNLTLRGFGLTHETLLPVSPSPRTCGTGAEATTNYLKDVPLSVLYETQGARSTRWAAFFFSGLLIFVVGVLLLDHGTDHRQAGP